MSYKDSDDSYSDEKTEKKNKFIRLFFRKTIINW